jgi:1-acyl-sn-glycerol-3-phosphate acyltransferase
MSLNERQPSWLSRLVRRVLVSIYKHGGWRANGVVPEPRKFVIIAAPHTSNWDFVYFLGLTEDLGVKPHFMAKTSLFRWPITNFMLDMGGVPVDRSSNRNYVQQMERAAPLRHGKPAFIISQWAQACPWLSV